MKNNRKSKSKEKKIDNRFFREAIYYLKCIKKIKYDIDVSKALDDYSKGVISDYIRDKTELPEVFAQKFCEKFDLPFDFVFYGKGNLPLLDNGSSDEYVKKIAELEARLQKVNKINDNYSDYIDQLRSKIERLEKELSKYEPKPTKHVSQ